MINPTVLPSEHSGPYTACVWYTGLYIARAFDPTVPGTKAEMLAIAAAGGSPTGASGNFTKLAAAMKARYGLVGAVYEGAAAAIPAVKAAVAAGPCVIGLAGDGYNLVPRYQDNHFGHAVAILYPSGLTGTQLDPLAAAGYAGDSFSETELLKFTTAAIIFKAPVVGRMALTQAAVTQDFDTVPGAYFARADGSTGKFNLAIRVHSVAEGIVNGAPIRLLDYGTDHEALVVPLSGLVLPGPRIVLGAQGISQAQLDAAILVAVDKAIAPLEITIKNQAGRIAAAKTALG